MNKNLKNKNQLIEILKIIVHKQQMELISSKVFIFNTYVTIANYK